jgi:hypothetical protein
MFVWRCSWVSLQKHLIAQPCRTDNKTQGPTKQYENHQGGRFHLIIRRQRGMPTMLLFPIHFPNSPRYHPTYSKRGFYETLRYALPRASLTKTVAFLYLSTQGPVSSLFKRRSNSLFRIDRQSPTQLRPPMKPEATQRTSATQRTANATRGGLEHICRHAANQGREDCTVPVLKQRHRRNLLCELLFSRVCVASGIKQGLTEGDRRRSFKCHVSIYLWGRNQQT